jgi:hypothetical protein
MPMSTSGSRSTASHTIIDNGEGEGGRDECLSIYAREHLCGWTRTLRRIIATGTRVVLPIIGHWKGNAAAASKLRKMTRREQKVGYDFIGSNQNVNHCERRLLDTLREQHSRASTQILWSGWRKVCTPVGNGAGRGARRQKVEVGTTEGIGETLVKREEVSDWRTTRSEKARVTILAFRRTQEDRKVWQTATLDSMREQFIYVFVYRSQCTRKKCCQFSYV